MSDTRDRENRLEQLLQLSGIASSYQDFAGHWISIPLANRLLLLQAMGVGIHNTTDLEELLDQQLLVGHGQLLSAAATLVAGLSGHCTLRFSGSQLTQHYYWRLQLEQGGVQSGDFTGSSLPVDPDPESEQCRRLGLEARLLPLPPLPAGYHRLQLSCEPGIHRECLLIAAPARCHEPDWVHQGRRHGGLSVQLYSLRSPRNWGIGDFTDLQEVISQAAAGGLNFIVLNPLHCLDLAQPESCSPYSPLDRRFLNPLYLDLTVEPDFLANASLLDYVGKPAFEARLIQLREQDLVDYESVARLKLVVLGKMYRHFCRNELDRNSARGQDFRAWVVSRGASLEEFSRFEAARHRLAMDQCRHAQFHCYLQWLAESQLESCQQLALSLGMTTGLVRDLAVGSNAGSAEVLLSPQLFSAAASIGAPPDPLAPQGQKWGLSPMIPQQLRNSAYRHFIQLLSSNMAHCGALRIDHVMSLMRLWWCPADGDSAAGAYVAYPVNELFAILRLESTRHRCLVIGEDLGVVPAAIRHHMRESGVFSNVLFYFEKYNALQFRQPQHYPVHALAMVANHDVPTLAAWWNKSDLYLRRQIGLLSDDSLAAAIGERESDLIQILHWLNEQGRLPQQWRDFNIHHRFDHGLCTALLQACGHSASLMVSLQVEDLLLEERPVNIPGTSTEYPNWRRRLTQPVAQLFSGSESRTMLDAFAVARNTP